MKIFLFLLCLWLASQGSSASDINNNAASLYEMISKEFKNLKDQDKRLKVQVEKLTARLTSSSTSDINDGAASLCEMISNEFKNLKKQNKRLKLQLEELTARLSKPKKFNMKSCGDWSEARSGKRKIYLANENLVDIYCDQDTDGGRWNVFQRRRNGSVDFYRGWSDYRNGFGDLDNEFWLGLETVHQMTSDGQKYELRFDLEKQDGSKYYAVYDNFSIGSESEGYAIHFTGYRGNAGDSFYGVKDMKFTTKDRDQDASGNSNCAVSYLGAWWYNRCHYSNLNGHYDDTTYAKGLTWHKLTGYYESLKKTEMKFRVQQ